MASGLWEVKAVDVIRWVCPSEKILTVRPTLSLSWTNITSQFAPITSPVWQLTEFIKGNLHRRCVLGGHLPQCLVSAREL